MKSSMKARINKFEEKKNTFRKRTFSNSEYWRIKFRSKIWNLQDFDSINYPQLKTNFRLRELIECPNLTVVKTTIDIQNYDPIFNRMPNPQILRISLSAHF